MEDETEVLDWGNEEDEQLDIAIGTAEADEDAVSLGEDDDEPVYCAYQQAAGDDPAATTRDTESRGRSPRSGFHGSRVHSRDHHREGSSSSFKHSAVQEPDSDSPQRQGTDSYSPHHRSHSFSSHNAPARLTHALPPKPVATSVPYLPPSHPSIVEATAMSNRARDSTSTSRKSNSAPSNGKTGSSASGQELDSPLPPDWEIRYPRGGGNDKVYYYNVVTEESTWNRPSAHAPSKASDYDADSSPQQQQGANVAITNSGLSYQDRHYRPGGDSSATPGNNRRNETGFEGSDGRYSTAKAPFSGTPPLSPRRARSLSPSQMDSAPPPARSRDIKDSRPFRGAPRPTRGRRSGTNHDTSPQRDRDLPDTNYDRDRSGRDRRWRPEEDADFNDDHDRGLHRRQQRQYEQQYPDEGPLQGSAEDRDRNRPFVRKGTYNRGRDREPPNLEPRESSRSQNQNQSMPTSRRRSPPRTRGTNSSYNDALPRQREPREDLPPSGGADWPPGSSTSRRRPTRFGPQPTASDTHSQTPPVIPGDTEVDELSYSRRPTDRDYDRSRDSLDEIDELAVTQQAAPVRAESYSRDYEEDASYLPRGRMSPAEDRGDSSRRKRAPLPPQDMTYIKETRKPSQGPGYREGARVPPAQRLTRPSVGAPDSDVPSGPRIRPLPLDTSFDRAQPPAGPASAGYDKGRHGWSDRRPSVNYEPAFPADASMDVDREQGGSRYPSSPSTRNPDANMRSTSGTFPSDAADAPRAPRAMNKPFSANTSGPPEFGQGSGRFRDRSPPPHLTGDRIDTRREYEGGRPGGGQWRDRGHGPPPYGRETRGRPPKPTTGTNDIPVGVRRRDGSAEPQQQNYSPPRYGPKYNTTGQPPAGGSFGVPSRDRELPPGKESYERPPHMDNVRDSFRNSNRYDNVPGRDRTAGPLLSPNQPYNRRPPASEPFGNRARQNRRSRFPPPEEREPQMRPWGARAENPPRELESQQEHEDAGATPPPLSREPSATATSPAWDSSQADLQQSGGDDTYAKPARSAAMEVDTPVEPEIKMGRPLPPLPVSMLPPPNIPMVSDIGKEQAEVPVAQIVTAAAAPAPTIVPPPNATLPTSNIAPPDLTGNSGDRRNVSPENRKRSRWGGKLSTDAMPVPAPTTEEQKPQRSTQRQPDFQEGPGQRNYPRRSFNGPQLFTDEAAGNSTTSYYRDSSRFGRYDQQHQLSDRIDTQRPEYQRRGASLLDRLGDPLPDAHPQSLRDRVQIPSKRDRDEVVGYGNRYDNSNEDDGVDPKRVKRRPGRMNTSMNRRGGGRRGGPP